LVSAAVLALSASLGARTGYTHASYYLSIDSPTDTILVFTLLGLGTFQLSKYLPPDLARLALMASRTCVLLVNFGFWIGSLWGAKLFSSAIQVPRWGFVVAWAVVIIAAGVWAASVNRRWLVNTAAIFGAIHFYTQWFELLGATPLSVLLGGLLILAFAAALWKFNRRVVEEAAPS
jgi:hypothetical protein